MSRRAIVAALLALAACSIPDVSFTAETRQDAGTAAHADATIDAGKHGLNGVATPTASVTCDPVTQAGCPAGDKCTWIVDELGVDGGNDLGNIGCAPDGTAHAGSACTGGFGDLGVDNCVHGTACVDGTCKPLCDFAITNTCGAAASCSAYSDFYAIGGTIVAGVCDPSCDPLTQRVGTFGTTTAASPPCPTTGSGSAQACYGEPLDGGGFSCSLAGSAQYTDGIAVPTADGGPFINSCAPGNISLFDFDINGVSIALCQGFCLPADTYVGSAANPSGIAPYTCQRAGVAGSAADSCVYAWSLGGEGTGGFDPTVDGVDQLEPWSGATSGTGVGLCWNYPAYDHFDPTDPENGSNVTQGFPTCTAVGLDATVSPETCTTAAPCNTAAKIDAIFGAVELGCVSFMTAQQHPETVMAVHHRRSPFANVRFADTATLHPTNR